MGPRTIRTFLLILGLVLVQSTGPACADEIDMLSFLQRTRAQMQWDPVRAVGTIWKGDTAIRFGIDASWVIVDYREQYRIDPVRRENGRIMLTEQTADRLALWLGAAGSVLDGRRVAAIFIDPGHGGKDPGAIGRHMVDGELIEIREKDIVLELSLILAEMLKRRYPHREIILSREDDGYLTLEERTELANRIETDQNEAVLFVSIHANASLNSRASGYEVWFLPPDITRTGLVNPGAVGVNDPDLLSILDTLKDEEITLESIQLARYILAGLQVSLGDGVENRGMKKESWYVVREAKMPSVLVELGFVTHAAEALMMRNSSYLNRLATGILNGIVDFIEEFDNQ
jgi:N-acetylmuramoyl-L-alanine amidase